MKRILILLIFSIFAVNCSKNSNKFGKLKINYRIVKLDERGNYELRWKDTLGKKNGYTKFNRPFELWTVLWDKNNDTIGKYSGFGAPQKSTDFYTTDSVIKIDFKLGVNYFYQGYFNKTDEEKKQLWNKNLKRITKYKPVFIDLNNLKKDIPLILEPK
ncbi:hypothetical protein OD91_1139 [Lutibacter sp. Hel_I_33_5]|uniref:hypothetical protein n=1 Tax=Lutibacter sp. Hel_I_33_5 TaxID=1566289 RepID=UPI0011A72881|nr:hypothetical protein [Lutibacter sp. Hel_I_33_5]TVZ55867.1 hypothetical protein OD91_1139 [Lutibacter sp. Hel_I_33_5]